MAINDIVQTIAEARVDARSLSEFVFKPAGFKVARRLAPTIDTLQFYVNSLSLAVTEAQGKVEYIETTVQDAINNTAVEGGVLADTFLTVENTINQRQVNRGFESIDELLNIANPKDGLRVYVKSYHAGLGIGGGYFIYDSSKSSINDKGNSINGWVREVSPNYYNVQNFGAVGDSNHSSYRDHEVFVNISNMISGKTSGSYTIHIPSSQGEYVVGKQNVVGNKERLLGESAIDIVTELNNNLFVHLHAEGKIKLRDNMKFGGFFKSDDSPDPINQSAETYTADVSRLIKFEGLKKLVITGSLEIDGNRHNQVIGGKRGDADWQLWAQGLYISDVKQFVFENIHSHNHLTDGLYISGFNYSNEPDKYDPELFGVVRNCQSLHNSRQGLSLCGGQNISFYDCTFAYSGLKEEHVVNSAPRSCLDIESELRPIRRVRFYSCNFQHAGSECVVADQGNTKHIYFYNCTINNHSTVWARMPDMRFYNCDLNGACKRVHAASVFNERTIFNGCSFRHDNDEFANPQQTGWVAIDLSSGNPSIKNCNFVLDNNLGFLSGEGSNNIIAGGAEVENCRVIIKDGVARELVAMTGNTVFKDVTIVDDRKNPNFLAIFMQGGSTHNVKILKTYEGAMQISSYYGNVVRNPMKDGALYIHNTPTTADYIDIKPMSSRDIYSGKDSTIQISYAKGVPTPPSNNGYVNKVGDRMYCTDPSKNIDYWVCTKSGDETEGNMSEWKAIESQELIDSGSSLNTYGDTASRPLNATVGFAYFDTTLNKPIYWTGSVWVDSTGSAV